MIKELTNSWRKAEEDFADFCMDYFDDTPVLVSQDGFEGEFSKVCYEENSNVLLFFERILIAIFRYIFVKKYVISEIIEDGLQKFGAASSHHDAFCGIVANACSALIHGSNAKRLIVQVGFT